jgi:hypothetical protein
MNVRGVDWKGSVGSVVSERLLEDSSKQLPGGGRGIFNRSNHAQTSLLVSEVMEGRGGRHVSLTRTCCDARLVRPSFLLVVYLGWN